MNLVVGLLTVECYLPAAQSLKDKRMVLRGVKDRLKKFNISIAEVDHQDVWQRAGLAIVSVSNDRALLDQTFSAALDEIDRVEPGLVTRSQVEWLT